MFLLLCGSAGARADAGAEGFDRLVEAAWLEARLDAPDLVIVDARPATEYRKGHLPGAISLPVASTFAAQPRNDLVGSVEQIEALFGQAGITAGAHVLVYDDGQYKDAARMFWVFEVFGVQNVALLNGGYPGWKQAGYPHSHAPVDRQAVAFVSRVRPERLATRYMTLLATEDPAVSLVDVRPVDEYRGKLSQSGRKGHIPGAMNIPATGNLVEVDGIKRFRPVGELESLYASLDREQPVIAYCNKGKDAAISYFTLRRLGYDVAKYDGSWFEWGSDHSLPIVQPLKTVEASQQEQ